MARWRRSQNNDAAIRKRAQRMDMRLSAPGSAAALAHAPVPAETVVIPPRRYDIARAGTIEATLLLSEVDAGRIKLSGAAATNSPARYPQDNPLTDLPSTGGALIVTEAGQCCRQTPAPQHLRRCKARRPPRRSRFGAPRRVPYARLRQLLFCRTKMRSPSCSTRQNRERVSRRRAQLPRSQIEAGMMPGTADAVADPSPPHARIMTQCASIAKISGPERTSKTPDRRRGRARSHGEVTERMPCARSGPAGGLFVSHVLPLALSRR